MIITRDNYEPFFLDYLEGKLEESLIDEFLDFLKLNPDLKEELHLFENIDLPEEQVVFPGKAHLYKPVREEMAALERKAIAFMEGDLRDQEGQLFEAYLASNPEMQKEYELFAQTRLVADAGIKYPGKENLYRKSGTLIWLNWLARAAAVVVILLGIHSLFQTESQTNLPTSDQEIALVKPQPAFSAKRIEPTIKTSETETGEVLASQTDPKPQNNYQPTKVNPTTTSEVNSTSWERNVNLAELGEIIPIQGSLLVEPDRNQLAVSHSAGIEKINDTRNIMTLDEFLVSRAKKAGDEGLLSAHRIIRKGLNVASELSGDRIAYSVKNGKVSSIGFESKLLAFSIPLQKK